MRYILLLALAFCPIFAFSQAARVDVPLQTVGPNVPLTGGPLPQVLWVANATVAVCTHGAISFSACQGTPITTYTDATKATPCPTNAQLTQLGGASPTNCSANAGIAGNVGFWYGGGIADYWIQNAYGTFGPFSVNPPYPTGGAPGIYTPPIDLDGVIGGAGSNGDVWLGCGTFDVPSGLHMSNSSVHLHGLSVNCTFVNFTSSAGLLVTGTNDSIDGITFEGATSNYSIEASSTAHGFTMTHCRLKDGGGFAGAPSSSAALYVQAPNQDITIEGNEFTGNGVTGSLGYVIKTDGSAAGYVQNFHFRHNWIHDNTSPDPLYTFDIANSDITDNVIDQGNNCGGTLCNNPAGNGVGYSVSIYSEAYPPGLTISSITRAGGVVTAVSTTAVPVSWPLNVGDDIFQELTLLGTNGTDFNGVFTITSISVDRKTLTWNQPGLMDDTGAGLGPPYANGIIIPPLQNVTVARNTITNSSGACIYFQGMSNVTVANNNLTYCDLQSQAGGHPQSAIGLNGVWGGSVTGNSIDHVGLTHGIAAQNSYFVTITGNSIGNIPLGMGVQIYDSSHLTVDGNTIHDALTGIGTANGTTPNCFHCSFSANSIRMKSNGAGIGFGAQDSEISITGGSIHAPQAGLSNAVIFLGGLTKHITVSGVTVNCQPDGVTAVLGVPTATVSLGIQSNTGAVENTIKGNQVSGCNNAGGAGIYDLGADDVISDNRAILNFRGIYTPGGTNQLISGNIVWGNTSAINTTGSTGAVVIGNQTTQGVTPIWYTFDFTGTTYTFGSNTQTLSQVQTNAAAGTQRIFGFLTAGVARWAWTADSGAEGGADAGTPLNLYAFHDNGASIDNPISIVRAAGGTITLGNGATPRPVKIQGGTNTVLRCATAGALPVGALTINAASCGTTADTGLRIP